LILAEIFEYFLRVFSSDGVSWKRRVPHESFARPRRKMILPTAKNPLSALNHEY
jgi:hypothetical protein